jgi:probable F420-dependent oxidoreductase
MQLGRLGVTCATDGMNADEAAEFARLIEQWGYSALWVPEAFGRNVLVHAAWLLANTNSLIVATGIANIYGRDPMAMAHANAALNEQSGGRFLLGIGVSHAPLVEGLRGHRYSGKPVAFMRDYLAAMAGTRYGAPAPPETPRTVIAALGPKMIALGTAAADGVHPDNVSPEYTATARAYLGANKWLCIGQKVILEAEPARARAAARANLAVYLTLPNYLDHWRRQGFADEDFSDGGSDRLIDAVFAWGGEKTIRTRIEAHWAAGADHVCIQAVGPDGSRLRPDMRVLQALAPAA